MVASPANPVLAQAFGGVVMASDTASGAVSYDDQGRRFVFVPGPGDTSRYALDIEPVSGQMSDAVMKNLGARSQEQGFKAWTVLEVQAKLWSVPVLALLRAPQQDGGDIELTRCDTNDYWIVVGKHIQSREC